MKTLKIKPSHESQGDFVEINEEDFDAAVHELVTGEKAPAPTRAQLDEALAGLPGEYEDPDFVVKGMRQHWGALFTEADEAQVRELVKTPSGNPSDGLTVAQLKEALAAKGVTIPDDVTLKADLAALLDAQPA